MPGFTLRPSAQRSSIIGIRCRRRTSRSKWRLGSRDSEEEGGAAGREGSVSKCRRGRGGGGGEENDDGQAAKTQRDELAPAAHR
ncbi:hypothetical protein PG997_013465 [Apiospora hydei]|uniref:Uncharacterized protein n=1 Tax=Apiospora hydei TaxID=1337664 RepID=A0ABR1V689_9PEZI